MRLLLVANPSASGFTGGLHREVVATLASVHDVEAVWPDGPDDAAATAAEASRDGFDAVLAIGGDGAVHHVVRGIAGTSTALGVVPAGTTNVYARILGLPSKATKAVRAFLEPTVREMPLALVSASGVEGARYATFSVGIGFDADVVQEADSRPHSKLAFGGLHYLRTVVGEILGPYRGKPATLRVSTDGHRVDALAAVVQVHRPYTYFGRLPIDLRRTDGDGPTMIALERISTRQVGGIVSRLITRRRLDGVPGVHVHRDVEKLIVEAEPAALVHSDGEILGRCRRLEVLPAASRLRVLVPR